MRSHARVVLTGADGVVILQVRGADELQRALDVVARVSQGINGSRSTRYRNDRPADAASGPMLIPIIENRDALANIDEICALPDIRAVSFGAGDLGQSLGVGARGMSQPLVREAFRRVIETARRHGTVVQAMPYIGEDSLASVEGLLNDGVGMILYGADALIFSRELRCVVRAVGGLARRGGGVGSACFFEIGHPGSGIDVPRAITLRPAAARMAVANRERRKEMNAMTLSERLARWAVDLRYEDLPPNVIHHVKRSLLDHLGVTIIGATSGMARTVRDFLSEIEGCGNATVIGTDRMLSPSNAAFANGVAVLVCELDDGHVDANLHNGATCIPAILAQTEAKGASGREMIVAIAVAYEIGTRLAWAADSASERFHTSPLTGVFGATVGAGKMLGCDAVAMAHAIGLAGSYTGGLHDFYEGWLDTWIVNNGGRVNREGLLCANLALRGISGPRDIFEGPRGFSTAFITGQFDAEPVHLGLGQTWSMLDTYIKIYPSCRRVHAVIDAALALRADLGIEAEDVERIVVEGSEDTARLDLRSFDSMAAAQMSVPYCAAAALVFGAPSVEHFEQQAQRDPRLRRLLDRVEVKTSPDPRIADSRKLAARVSITARGGKATRTVIDPLGDPVNPISDAVVEAKFHMLADPVIGRSSAERLRILIRDADAPRSAEDEAYWREQFFRNCRTA